MCGYHDKERREEEEEEVGVEILYPVLQQLGRTFM
jgi:hypothetical protein